MVINKLEAGVKMIKAIYIILILGLFKCIYAVEPPSGIPKNITFTGLPTSSSFSRSPYPVYSPIRWGRINDQYEITYYIGNGMDEEGDDVINPTSIPIEWNEHTYNRDFVAIIQEAMSEWTTATGITFRRVKTRASANLDIEFGLMSTAYALTYAEYLPEQQRQSSMTIYQENIRDSGYTKMREIANLGIFEAANDEALLDMFLRMLLKHELGHVLGEQHPSGYASDDTPPIYSSSGDAIFNAENMVGEENMGVPIVTRSLEEYFKSLYTYINRGDHSTINTLHRIRLEDIQIAPQEGMVMRMLWIDNNCTTSSSSSKRSLEKQGDQCFPYTTGDTPPPSPPQSWSSDVACTMAGFLAFDKISCSSSDGLVNFLGQVSGIGGAGIYDGTIYFTKGYSAFKGKTCHIKTIQIPTHLAVNINCGNNAIAELRAWGAGAIGVMTGDNGSFN